MKLRYGFKKEAEAKALALREEVGAGPLDPVDVFKVAKYLGAIVVSLSELRTHGARAESIQHFHSVEPKAFSALTVQRGERSLIIYNEVHAQGRIANSLAHESSHIALKHKRPSGVVMGCRQWDGNQEGEADWLGGMHSRSSISCSLGRSARNYACWRCGTFWSEPAAHADAPQSYWGNED